MNTRIKELVPGSLEGIEVIDPHLGGRPSLDLVIGPDIIEIFLLEDGDAVLGHAQNADAQKVGKGLAVLWGWGGFGA
jgi:hypothetical protein